VAGADGGSCVCTCRWGPHPCQFWVDPIGAGVGRRDAIIFIYLQNVL
jgi:hypothetical protein